MENIIQLKDGTTYSLASYSYGGFGALIIQIRDISLTEVITKFDRNNTEKIVITIENSDPVVLEGYQKVAFVSSELYGAKVALEMENNYGE